MANNNHNDAPRTRERRIGLYEYSGLGELSKKAIQQLEWHTEFWKNEPDLREMLKRMLTYYSAKKKQEGGVNHLWDLPAIPKIGEEPARVARVHRVVRQVEQPQAGSVSPAEVIILDVRPGHPQVKEEPQEEVEVHQQAEKDDDEYDPASPTRTDSAMSTTQDDRGLIQQHVINYRPPGAATHSDVPIDPSHSSSSQAPLSSRTPRARSCSLMIDDNDETASSGVAMKSQSDQPPPSKRRRSRSPSPPSQQPSPREEAEKEQRSPLLPSPSIPSPATIRLEKEQLQLEQEMLRQRMQQLENNKEFLRAKEEKQKIAQECFRAAQRAKLLASGSSHPPLPDQMANAPPALNNNGVAFPNPPPPSFAPPIIGQIPNMAVPPPSFLHLPPPNSFAVPPPSIPSTSQLATPSIESPCAFCFMSGHPPEHCTEYGTNTLRKKRQEQLRLCIQCLQPFDHFRCMAPEHKERSCSYCGNHRTHIALCRKLYR